MAKPYDGPVIDPHIHLWDLAGGHYPWLAPNGGVGFLPSLEQLQRNYLPEDYLRDAAGQGIVATVHVEALWNAAESPVEETRWLESIDKPNGVAARYVAGTTFGEPGSAAILEEQAGFARVAGVRQVISWHPDPAKTMRPEPGITRTQGWRESARRAADLGLVVDVLMFPWQADEVAEVAKAIPELTIVVDHAASPIERDPENIDVWRTGLAVMAAQPNVSIKVSALGVPDDDARWGEDGSFGFLMSELIGAFGSDRAMFASDFPVGRLKNTFEGIYGRFRAFAAQLSLEDQRKLFFDNAERLYFGGSLS
jgi:predicted TIM-barrel fold metal-dependent hydrolase